MQQETLKKWYSMLFNDLIWNLNFSDLQNLHGAVSFQCSDDVITRLVKDKAFSQNRYVHAKDLTIDWFESTFQNLSLFATDDAYFILGCEQLKADVKKWIQENFNDGLEKDLVFHSKKKFELKLGGTTISNKLVIKEPPFWEHGRLLNFLAQNEGMKLSPDASNLLLERIEGTTHALVNALNILKLVAGESISYEDVDREISKAHIDQFKLATLFNKKQMKEFFGLLINTELTKDDFQKVAFFMSSHIQKIIDPTYMNKKKKLSKYDREIESASRSWNKKQLLNSLVLFQELEKKSRYNESPRNFLMDYQVRILTP
jgi:DNA polymerase III delta subunit